MKMNQPLGDSMYGPLFIRFTLGSYFIFAGLLKIQNLQGFVDEVQKLNILPEHLASLYGIVLPYFEIASGVLLVVGIWTTLAAGLVSLMLLSYIIAFGFFPNTNSLFNKDVILLGAALSLLYTGSGAWSIDRFRKMG